MTFILAAMFVAMDSSPVIAQKTKKNPPAPAVPAPPAPEAEKPKAPLTEEQRRELEKQIEESEKLLHEYREVKDEDSTWSGEHTYDERVEIGSGVEIGEDEVITGDVVAVGGDVDVHGKIMGDAVAVGGEVHVYPDAVVRGDAVSVGGKTRVDEGAQVNGERVSVDIGLPLGALHLGQSRHVAGFEHSRGWGVFANLVWIGATLLLALLFFAVAGGRIDVISRRVEAQPGQSFLIGLLGAFATPIATVITVVLLAITIIGILLIPVLFLLEILMFTGGFVAVALAVGRRILAWRRASGDLSPARSPYFVLTVGFVALHGLCLLGTIFGATGIPILPGLFKGFGIFTIIFSMFLGYGALLLSRFGKTLPGPALPPLPPPPQAPPAPDFPPPPSRDISVTTPSEPPRDTAPA
ncbi:MAG TPA: hypothetical protein VFR10_00770 [bacterium]|nr:hypothetical protein [bacterium]